MDGWMQTKGILRITDAFVRTPFRLNNNSSRKELSLSVVASLTLFDG